MQQKNSCWACSGNNQFRTVQSEGNLFCITRHIHAGLTKTVEPPGKLNFEQVLSVETIGRCATVVTTSRHPKFAFAHLLDYAMLTCKHFRNCNHFLARQRAYNVHPCSLLLRLIPSLQVSRSKGAQRNVIVGRMRAMLQALCGKSWCGFVGLGLQ